ncbi:PASTA domain-containing protein [Patulibacter defluvii]|uniref:PASTA domain-containing protein n=1 Tax=Patulibacter defluvii TaxID=3095358 RepID=UPI002A749BEF|nr:PASTA domain-containing protein [Patulibacter sp. DM4]
MAVLALALPAGASAQATRTWVSGVGDDVNPCSRTAPCKTWAGAISKTATGGEINALDPGGFGTLTITKSITIDGGGMLAGTLASGTTGFVVNVPPGNPLDGQRRVVLRNLSINGTGTTPGVNGVRIDAARSVSIENSQIENFSQNGIRYAPTESGDSSLVLDGVRLRNNLGNGLFAIGVPTQKLGVLVRDTVISGSRGGSPTQPGVGLNADTASHVWLTGSSIFDNQVGIAAGATNGAPAGIVDDYCDNQVAGNVDDGATTNRVCPPPVTVVQNPAPAPTPTPTPTPTAPAAPVVRCTVPKLTGLTLAGARGRLAKADCGLGKVTRTRTRKRASVGRVLRQGTAAGKRLPKGTKVAVVVGKR